MWNSSPPSEAAEEFYESLDRILSSSCSSTSASDDEASVGDHRLHHHRRLHRPPSFPPPVACSYDVWIAEPSSVEERRRRLLQQLGLIEDLALSRNRTTVREANGWLPEAGPSTSRRTILSRQDEASLAASASAVAVMGRSRSDGSVDPNRVNKEQPQRRAVSFESDAPSKPSGEGDCGGFQLGSGGSGDGDSECTIKNLDDGSEFVVKEIRKDGLWNKLREVGTGRQLTMEEFEMCVGRSPIVQELMRRQNIEGTGDGGDSGCSTPRGNGAPATVKSKKKSSWFKSIRNIAGTVVAGGHHHRDRRAGDEKDGSLERAGARRSSSATDESLDGFHSLLNSSERIRVRQYGKSCKELSGLYITQEIQSHNGAIWTMKFSPDGRHLATAGVDCIIHVREVSGLERNGELLQDEGAAVGEKGNCYAFLAAISSGSPTQQMALSCIESNQWEKRRSKSGNSRRSVSSDHLMVPEHVFTLSEKPICSFSGHTEDVLDLSWSKSQYLLSSSMDKTVRLWCMSNSSCLKIFSHSDYVTCIQFNPVDDRYFISGSLDEKVRLWNIPNRQIIDWHDTHEMITATCFTPDGQGALVGTHKGGCHMFDTSENKLHFKSQIDLQNKKKNNHKKITGFQFAPGSSSEVLITSADSRIRVVIGVDLVHKFKGFRNTSSQISACISPNGKYVICASEDSYVYMWRYDSDAQPSRMKGIVNVTQSYEHFHCHDVTVAVIWPGVVEAGPSGQNQVDCNSDGVCTIETGVVARINGQDSSLLHVHRFNGSPLNSHNTLETSSTWSEEKLLVNELCHHNSGEFCNGATQLQSRSAWGMTIVTAGRGGEIRAFQNFGFPFRV